MSDHENDVGQIYLNERKELSRQIVLFLLIEITLCFGVSVGIQAAPTKSKDHH